MRILVTGAAGYIGSHTVKLLLGQGHHVVGLDNLCNGHIQALPREVPFFSADIQETSLVSKLLEQQDIDSVMHFAGLACVGESYDCPLDYYLTNTSGTLSLLQAIGENRSVKKIVFSSSCSIYGNTPMSSINEDCPKAPLSPYSRSKLFAERALEKHVKGRPEFICVALRYFNAAGAAFDGTLGEDHRPENHLIPSILRVALGKAEYFAIRGQDYPTADGTCIRDYVHVEDIAAAHALALQVRTPGFHAYNLGSGQGASVRDVLRCAQDVIGRDIETKIWKRRPGDAARLVADISRSRDALGWAPRHGNLRDIIASAWNWMSKHPNGYSDRP